MATFDPSSLTITLELGTPGAMFPLQSRITWWKNVDDVADGSEYRGEDRTIPHVIGDKAMPRTPAKKVVMLEGLIRGDVDILNAPYSNKADGLLSNRAYIEYYGSPAFSPAADRTRTLRLVRPSGVRYGPVHATFKMGQRVGPAKRLITAELSLPEGGLWNSASS